MRLLLCAIACLMCSCATAQATSGTTIYVAVLMAAQGTQITDMIVMGASETKEACEKAVAGVLERAGEVPAGMHVDAHCLPFALPYAPTKAQPRAKVTAAPGEQEL